MAFRLIVRGPSALRSFTRVRQNRPTIRPTLPQRQHVAWRGYASEGGHGEHSKPGSDIPWALGGIAVTIPSCWYLWPSSSGDHSHGHHEEHNEHEEHHDDAKEQQEAGESSADSDSESQASSKTDDDGSEKAASQNDSEKSESNNDSDASKTAEGDGDGSNNEDSNVSEQKNTKGGKVEGVRFKGRTSAGDDDNEMPHTRKIESDSKGANKKRLDSGYQTDLGSTAEGDGDDESESAATSKPVSENQGDISNKQKGLSNTPTRHSTDIGQDPEKAKKGEGVPETAKSMGTVSVNRSPAENRGGQ